MKCQEFAEIVHQLARPGRLDKVEAAIARAHAESCPACACLLADAEGLAAIFRKASAESRSLGAPERVESALVAAFQNANAANSQQLPRRKRSWRLAMAGVYAAAAVAVIVFALLGRTLNHRSSPAARTGSAVSTTMVAEQKTSATQPVSGQENSAAATGVNQASGFVPVPFAGGFAQGDSGVIVRVQVPRSALAELGYPVDETQGGGMVQADMLVGEDGWPRAVRIAK